jgi:hypothetical protein
MKRNNKMKFKVGDRIRDAYDRSDKGVVVKVVDPLAEIIVKWDETYDAEVVHISRLEPHEIRIDDPEADKAKALLVQAKIDAATHSLEAAFNSWKEAAELNGGEVIDLVNDDLLNVKGFAGTIEANVNGWRSSSLYC